MEEKYGRLLNMKEFAIYAGRLSRNTASRLSIESDCRIRVGRRVLIDREKFDAWVDGQSGRC